MSRMRALQKTQAGFSLVEIMVAVLVLSLAFLSLGALAARSLSSNGSAMSRSVATIAAYSILDAMRADRPNAEGGSYNTLISTPIAANNCPAADTTLASVQLKLWCDKQLGDPALGGHVATTTGEISCNAAGTCTVIIKWDDSRNGNVPGTSDTIQQVTTTGML